jgi:hypothetical protein
MKTINGPRKAIKILLLLLVLSMTGCGEKDVDPVKPTPGGEPGGGNPTITPVPTGTVTAVNYSIAYGEKAVINYQFFDTDSAWVTTTKGTVKLPGISGQYTSDSLKATTGFAFSMKGKGGIATLPSVLTITVAQDPKIDFLLHGYFDYDSVICRPVGGNQWTQVPDPNATINHYSYFYDNFSGPPGNNGTVIYMGTLRTFKWYFTGENGFWSNGIAFDQFTITGSNTFKVHRFGPVPESPNGEYWDFFKRK